MTEREKQDVIHALKTLSKHKAIIGCKSCTKTAEFALRLLEEQQEQIETLKIAQDKIADFLTQPEIVRCKDCRHYKNGMCWNEIGRAHV